MTPELRERLGFGGWVAATLLVMSVYWMWQSTTSSTPRVAAEDEQPTHRVRVWCPDRRGHIDLRLPGFAQSVVIDVAAACGATVKKP
jgi:hypothetical protein